MKKMTFTLDVAAVREIDRAAERLDISKSQVVREAVRLYGEQLGRLSEEEREAKLAVFDELVPRIPSRTREEVEGELEELRETRRGGGRRGSGS